jgi:hypothetical protein
LIVCPTVFATAVPTTRNAAKLNAAAHATATRGRRTWVATTVAMALAESWKPLVKSNSRANAMRPINAAVVTSIGAAYPGRPHHSCPVPIWSPPETNASRVNG